MCGYFGNCVDHGFFRGQYKCHGDIGRGSSRRHRHCRYSVGREDWHQILQEHCQRQLSTGAGGQGIGSALLSYRGK